MQYDTQQYQNITISWVVVVYQSLPPLVEDHHAVIECAFAADSMPQLVSLAAKVSSCGRTRTKRTWDCHTRNDPIHSRRNTLQV